MSGANFKQGDALRAAQLNRSLLEAGAQAGAVAGAAAGAANFGVPLDRYGTVDRTGAQDMAALFNEAILRTAAAGDPLWVSPGRYRFNGPIIMQSGMRLYCSPAADLRGHFATTGTNNGLLKPAIEVDVFDTSKRLRDMEIVGGVWGVAGVADATGRYWIPSFAPFFAFKLLGDDIRVRGVRFRGTSQGNCIVTVGERITIQNVTQELPRENLPAPFISIWSGKRVRLENYWLQSGGDAVAIGAPMNNGLFSDRNLEDVLVTGGQMDVMPGRALVAGLGTGPGFPEQGGLTCYLRDVEFSHCQAAVGPVAISLYNTDSSERLDNVVIDNCSFTMRDATANIKTAITVASLLGGVGVIRVSNVKIRTPVNAAISSQGIVRQLYLRDIDAEIATASGTAAVVLNGVKAGAVEGCRFVANGNTGIHVGTTDAIDPNEFVLDRASRSIVFRETIVANVANDAFAWRFMDGDGHRLTDGCRVEKATGATTARAILFDNASANNDAHYNDFRDCGHAAPILDQGTGNLSFDNKGVPPIDGTLTVSTPSASTFAWSADASLVRLTGTSISIATITGTPTYAARMTILSTQTGNVVQSTAAILLRGGSNVTLNANETLELIYDPPSAVWREVQSR